MPATYQYTYTVREGCEREHDEWVRNVGIPWWRRQSGFNAFRANTVLIGSGPGVECEVDFDRPEDITRAMETPEAISMWQQFAALTRDLETKVLVPAPFLAGTSV